MQDLKYVVIRTRGFMPQPVALIFDALLDHKAAVGNHECLGAGFVFFDAQGIPTPYGRSTTLQIGEGEHDREALRIVGRQLFKYAPQPERPPQPGDL